MSPFPYTTIVLAGGVALGLGLAAIWALVVRGAVARPATEREAQTGPPAGPDGLTVAAGNAVASPTSGRTVLARAASYAGLALILGAASLLGTPGIAALALVLGALGLVEWSRLANLPVHHRIALQVANATIIALVAAFGARAAEWIIGGVILAGMAWPVIRPDPSRAMRDLGFAALGTIFLPGMLAHGVGLVVERGPLGAATFVALAVAVAFSDIGAFVVGRRFGRTPLSPLLSPAKTRAGLVGNLLGAGVGVAAFSPVLITGFGLGFALLLVPIIGFGAVWGDLLESAVKREAGQKDAGQWLPGFGGILDRIDSLLITLPLVFWAIRLVDLVRAGS